MDKHEHTRISTDVTAVPFHPKVLVSCPRIPFPETIEIPNKRLLSCPKELWQNVPLWRQVSQSIMALRVKECGLIANGRIQAYIGVSPVWIQRVVYVHLTASAKIERDQASQHEMSSEWPSFLRPIRFIPSGRETVTCTFGLFLGGIPTCLPSRILATLRSKRINSEF